MNSLNGIALDTLGNIYVSDGNNQRIRKIDAVYQSSCSWTGNVNSIWENAANWSCGFVPNSSTQVFINSGTVVLSSNATIWSLTVAAGASLTVNPPYNLTVTH